MLACGYAPAPRPVPREKARGILLNKGICFEVVPSSRVVRTRCDRRPVLGQHAADRLDATEAVTVLVDEPHERVRAFAVARCTVERLMRALGIQGARRSGKKVRTTVRDDGHQRAPDLLKRDLTAPAPDRRWVADFTYVATSSANQAGIDVQATIHGFDDPFPREFIERFATPKGGAPFTWGGAILNRIGARNSLYRNTYPFGSPFTGWVGN